MARQSASRKRRCMEKEEMETGWRRVLCTSVQRDDADAKAKKRRPPLLPPAADSSLPSRASQPAAATANPSTPTLRCRTKPLQQPARESAPSCRPPRRCPPGTTTTGCCCFRHCRRWPRPDPLQDSPEVGPLHLEVEFGRWGRCCWWLLMDGGRSRQKSTGGGWP
jgi:hypothetical protein